MGQVAGAQGRSPRCRPGKLKAVFRRSFLHAGTVGLVGSGSLVLDAQVCFMLVASWSSFLLAARRKSWVFAAVLG